MKNQRNVVMAFSEEDAVRLTGISLRQLRYWDRTGFFRPAFAAENRRVAFSRIYSFKDLVSLRVLNALKNQFQVSLQHLRQVSQKLAHLKDERWTKTTLYVLNRKVVFSEPETGKPREIVSGQYIVPLPLEIVIADTREAVHHLRKREADKIGRIERRRQVNHNAPVLAGTRVPVAAIKRFNEAGYSTAQIIEEYPDLTPADIEAAIAFDDKPTKAA